jgi:hypothetical protein
MRINNKLPPADILKARNVEVATAYFILFKKRSLVLSRSVEYTLLIYGKIKSNIRPFIVMTILEIKNPIE